MNCFKIQRTLRSLLQLQCSHIRFLSYIREKLKESYTFKPGDIPLSSSTISQILDEAADSNGDAIAFISDHQGIKKNFTDFRNEVDRLASGFVSLGLKKGDRIGLYSPNCYEWPLTQYAAAKAGLILVTINPAYQPSELEYCLKKVGCKALVTWDSFKTQNFYDILCGLIPELPSSHPNDLNNSNFPNLKTIMMISKDRKTGILNFNDALQSGNKESDRILSEIEKSIQFDDPANIQYTSGTTGRPKGVVLSHHNIVNNCVVLGRRMGYHLQKPIICCQVPLFHCFGCVFGSTASVMFRGTCIFPSAGFNAVESLKSVEKNRCTVIYGTPTMHVDGIYNFKLQNYDVSSLKQAVVGGSPAVESLIEELKETFGLSYINIAYGSTENSPAVAVNGIDDDFEKAVKGLLKPLEYIELKIVDRNGRLVPINAEGELCVRGHNLFLGYWQDPEKTAEVVEKTNWYHTGDLTVMDEEGCIKIVGRIKDMIIRGGENIYPMEIENFLNTHPAILEVNVVGVPDKRMGEEVCAWISVKKDMNLTEEEVKNFCRGKISHFKIPRYIMFVDDFPKTTSGKIKKYEMVRISTEKLKL
ncbi:medium-chain acyl-CoA ligase ACSF2, mitochondrial-like [Argiope bruennichi]|uniref:medium-chain acyl-CoA ligase ACSF2, mitochondrial-like n=1 Tax=Argiope bruennichi TaxID=94029 RepID=UPI002494E51C|nr:medium-chain acyl-CoA ligase ACSF2, mitochondrial-like [Argiope bruennichi]XP_055932647.1 medium-chain acyl-CoA ligase ACSF2, mitochondrial-like [Argiope bruennichi]XP_055932648.1 medium-chain acyl-CoA ligase ACSF2, mitochondrial-like [Argiope bruennichi]XP_055932649.1 medium-chain acyl-CoA ligase ACSF2, mitochondrial-like [Argiope bruennichi]